MQREEDPLIALEGENENDEPIVVSCCGTEENAYYCWYNQSDSAGLVCSTLVWMCILFNAAVVALSVHEGNLPNSHGAIILLLCFMALWSHARTMFADPGAVPSNAHPLPQHLVPSGSLSVCGRCDGYKPPGSHHDRVSNRCISRMDHFCPWMNNAIGAKNQKNFFLFLIYTSFASIYIYVLLAIRLIDCSAINCVPFSGVTLLLVRIQVFVLLFGFIFTFSMIVNQVYGLYTGYGTIDRMKTKTFETRNPIPFTHVFGVSLISYVLPFDTVFEDESKVLNYIKRKEKFTVKV